MFTNIDINLCEKSIVFCRFQKLCHIKRKVYLNPNSLCLELHGILFLMSLMSLIFLIFLIDIIENQVHPVYVIGDRNQEFIFLHRKHFVFTTKRLVVVQRIRDLIIQISWIDLQDNYLDNIIWKMAKHRFCRLVWAGNDIIRGQT